jgi:hypothetical protein
MTAINRPKEPGEYIDRQFDCARALQEAFDKEIKGNESRYFDVSHIAALLMERATNAGWTTDDVAAAVAKLASNRQTSAKDIHRRDAENALPSD